MTDEAKSTIERGEPDLIQATERERLRALVERDIPGARQLHADDFQLRTPAGSLLSREQYLDAVASGDIRYFAWEPVSEIDVRLYGDAAVIRYRSHMSMGEPGHKTVLHCWHTDTYEKRDGRWQVVWSQATRIR